VVEVAVIAPRHRAEELVEDLIKFEDFHPREKPKYRDPQLYEMERRLSWALSRPRPSYRS
jgi:hypothetical protein